MYKPERPTPVINYQFASVTRMLKNTLRSSYTAACNNSFSRCRLVSVSFQFHEILSLIAPPEFYAAINIARGNPLLKANQSLVDVAPTATNGNYRKHYLRFNERNDDKKKRVTKERTTQCCSKNKGRRSQEPFSNDPLLDGNIVVYNLCATTRRLGVGGGGGAEDGSDIPSTFQCRIFVMYRMSQS